MRIFPAVDLYEGKVVRLARGDYSQMKCYGASPLEAAKSFLDAGCEQIHIVDLEGAKVGEPKHLKILSEIAALGLFVQYGGGLRSAGAIASAVDAGAGRVMAGSIIFKDMDGAPELAARFGEQIMAAVDVKGGKVVHSGWLASTDLSAAEAVEKLAAVGFSSFLVTLTERDGMMAGTDASLYAALIGRGRFIAAAGGVTALRDLRALASVGVDAAVVGKSLYEGGESLKNMLECCSELENGVK